MKKLLILLTISTFLVSCAGINEMSKTGEPPVSLVNLYSASVKVVTRAAIVREPWNYGAGILSAATNGGIELRVENPDE